MRSSLHRWSGSSLHSRGESFWLRHLEKPVREVWFDLAFEGSRISAGGEDTQMRPSQRCRFVYQLRQRLLIGRGIKEE